MEASLRPGDVVNGKRSARNVTDFHRCWPIAAMSPAQLPST